MRLQPSWRRDGDLPWPPKRTRSEGEINWGSMAKGGLSGFSLFLVGIVWWKAYLDTDPSKAAKPEESEAEWEPDTAAELESFVEDLRWVLEGIVGDIKAYGVEEVMSKSKDAREAKKVASVKSGRGRTRDIPDGEIVDGPRKR